MKGMSLAVVLSFLGLLLLAGMPLLADEAATSSEHASTARSLEAIVDQIAPIPQEQVLRRSIAQATFCLPQNILGSLLYGLLWLTGAVEDKVNVNEVAIIVTRAPVGISLGRYIILHKTLVRENVVRHEYGHVLQGYQHGPFYLLLEGLASVVQASVSILSPSYAANYYNRWPEDEANALGAGI